MRSLALMPAICLALSACVPPRVASRGDAFDDPRARALAGARRGMGVRIESTSRETVQGQLVALSDAAITLDVGGSRREIAVATIERLHLNYDYAATGTAASAGAGISMPLGSLATSIGGPYFGVLLVFPAWLAGAAGMVAAGLAGGWQQVFPDRIHPDRWMTPARMSAGVLTAYVRLERSSVEAGDTLRAFVDLVNAGDDSVDVLERSCGPLVALVGPAQVEWVMPCAPGLRVVRVGPGRLTRNVELPTRMATGPYHVEYRVVQLALGRAHAFDTHEAVRFAARSGVRVR